METKAQDLFDMGYTIIDGAETENGGVCLKYQPYPVLKFMKRVGKLLFCFTG